MVPCLIELFAAESGKYLERCCGSYLFTAKYPGGTWRYIVVMRDGGFLPLEAGDEGTCAILLRGAHMLRGS